MLYIIIGVKPDEVGPHDAPQQAFFPFRRQQAKYFIRREWDMEKEPNGSIFFFLTQQIWQQHQLIVVYPYLIVGQQQGRQLFCKLLVDLYISIEELAII